ncbi:HAD-IIIA family hydrolase [Bacteroidales bacterium]|nr:HAD-IIIA family hydrolase [Bacteroidales bacterium]
MTNFKANLANIKALVFDVDGVFTNSKVYLHPSGEMMRSMNIKDGYAIQHAVKQGIVVCIITGGTQENVKIRFEKLGVTDIYLGSAYKMDDFEDFMFKYSFQLNEVLYMGDDMPDLEIMQKVGVAACPNDAVHEIKELSQYISDKSGGDGCVRDVIEQVLKLQDKWTTSDSVIW